MPDSYAALIFADLAAQAEAYAALRLEFARLQGQERAAREGVRAAHALYERESRRGGSVEPMEGE